MLDKNLPVPTPIKIRDHVLVMDFIGEGSRAAPSKFEFLTFFFRIKRLQIDQR
jgi:RIO-like serine/threonine protein kinase